MLPALTEREEIAVLRSDHGGDTVSMIAVRSGHIDRVLFDTRSRSRGRTRGGKEEQNET